MSVTKKLKKGQARMQFTACKDRIHQLQEAGCDIRMIYNNLIDEGLITMTYGGFYENFTQRRKKVLIDDASHVLKKSNLQSKRIQKQPADLQNRRKAFGDVVDKNLVETEKISTTSYDTELSEHEELLKKHC